MTENPASLNDAELKSSTSFAKFQIQDINRLNELKNECGANSNCHATFASMIQFANYELETVYTSWEFQTGAQSEQAARLFNQTFNTCTSNGGSAFLCNTVSLMVEAGWDTQSGKGNKSGPVSVGVKQPKASTAPVGTKVPTPTTNPELFNKGPGGTYVGKKSGEIFSKSHTNHSKSEGFEWKVGYGGKVPTSGKKVTLDQFGKVIKHDK